MFKKKEILENEASPFYKNGNISCLFNIPFFIIATEHDNIGKTGEDLNYYYTNVIKDNSEKLFHYCSRFDVFADRILNDYVIDDDAKSEKIKKKLRTQVELINGEIDDASICYIDENNNDYLLRFTGKMSFNYIYRYESLGTLACRYKFYDDKIKMVDELIQNSGNNILDNIPYHASNEMYYFKKIDDYYDLKNPHVKSMKAKDLYHLLVYEDEKKTYFELNLVTFPLLYERVINNYEEDDDVDSYIVKRDALVYFRDWYDFDLSGYLCYVMPIVMMPEDYKKNNFLVDDATAGYSCDLKNFFIDYKPDSTLCSSIRHYYQK